eukprot:gnl/Spiro4/6268_TR3229_c0_g1_i1.p1 gnl/Spiro4/6268_TR3229_c0_g1~~gnl/Spiro4/6268_TR3229_c0_g1_i1.p1  ORF type:complete len:323 (-),score=61.87 gnl/Spiro4/6268_TR3229_c0_g1_i1:56-1024(-)
MGVCKQSKEVGEHALIRDRSGDDPDLLPLPVPRPRRTTADRSGSAAPVASSSTEMSQKPGVLEPSPNGHPQNHEVLSNSPSFTVVDTAAVQIAPPVPLDEPPPSTAPAPAAEATTLHSPSKVSTRPSHTALGVSLIPVAMSSTAPPIALAGTWYSVPTQGNDRSGGSIFVFSELGVGDPDGRWEAAPCVGRVWLRAWVTDPFVHYVEGWNRTVRYELVHDEADRKSARHTWPGMVRLLLGGVGPNGSGSDEKWAAVDASRTWLVVAQVQRVTGSPTGLCTATTTFCRRSPASHIPSPETRALPPPDDYLPWVRNAAFSRAIL